MATTVRITETYDLKTTLNRIGIIGIHTPNPVMINSMYPGLAKNHKFLRLLSCDVVGVCASALPPDPYQISSGAISPEDMFNPILYKAVTNESFETLQNRITGQGSPVGAFGSVDTATTGITSPASNFAIYYSLLASKDGFKKCMPQNGFKMTRLRPLCHTLISTYGNVNGPIKNAEINGGIEDVGNITSDGKNVQVSDAGGITSTSAGLDTTDKVDKAVTFRGKPVPYPRIPLHIGPEAITDLGFADDGYAKFKIPKTMCGMLIIPPARQTIFSYRVRVSWKIRFEGLISTNVMGSTTGAYSIVGPMAHGMNWTPSSSKDGEPDFDIRESDSIDTQDVELNKIMLS